MKHSDLVIVEELWEALTPQEQEELRMLIPATEDKYFYKLVKKATEALLEIYEDCPNCSKTLFCKHLFNIMIRLSLVEETDKYEFAKWNAKAKEYEI